MSIILIPFKGPDFNGGDPKFNAILAIVYCLCVGGLLTWMIVDYCTRG